MPEPRTPEQDADDAARYYAQLVAKQVPDVAARQFTAAYILGQMRRADDKPDWETELRI